MVAADPGAAPLSDLSTDLVKIDIPMQAFLGTLRLGLSLFFPGSRQNARGGRPPQQPGIDEGTRRTFAEETFSSDNELYGNQERDGIHGLHGLHGDQEHEGSVTTSSLLTIRARAGLKL